MLEQALSWSKRPRQSALRPGRGRATEHILPPLFVHLHSYHDWTHFAIHLHSCSHDWTLLSKSNAISLHHHDNNNAVLSVAHRLGVVAIWRRRASWRLNMYPHHLLHWLLWWLTAPAARRWLLLLVIVALLGKWSGCFCRWCRWRDRRC